MERAPVCSSFNHTRESTSQANQTNRMVASLMAEWLVATARMAEMLKSEIMPPSINYDNKFTLKAS